MSKYSTAVWQQGGVFSVGHCYQNSLLLHCGEAHILWNQWLRWTGAGPPMYLWQCIWKATECEMNEEQPIYVW